MIKEEDVVNVLIIFLKNKRYEKMASFFLTYAIDDIVHDYNKFNEEKQTLKEFILDFLKSEIEVKKINREQELGWVF